MMKLSTLSVMDDKMLAGMKCRVNRVMSRNDAVENRSRGRQSIVIHITTRMTSACASWKATSAQTPQPFIARMIPATPPST